MSATSWQKTIKGPKVVFEKEPVKGEKIDLNTPKNKVGQYQKIYQMKTFLRFSGLTSIFILIVLIGCNKSQDQVTKDDNHKSNFVNPKEDVGVLHNEALKYVLENTTEIPISSETKSFVEQILNQKYDSVSLDSIPEIPSNIDSLDLLTWLNEFNISTDLKSEIAKTFTLFESEPDLAYLISEIEAREVAADSLFEGEELNKYYEHLAVAKYTATFWYPESQGGLNGIQYLNIGSLKSTQAVNWWKVLGVDVVGGVMGGMNPVTYAGASAIAVIMMW